MKVHKIKHIVLVASGKGGVGKSMVATNLAVSLAREGYKTGLLDADLYGPSLPLIMGLENERLYASKDGDKEVYEPLVSYDVKVMSLGFMMKPEDAVIWRGPMAASALTSLIENTNWGDLDYLIVDTPPGTGDIAITLAQKLPQSKALVVITPQKIALADGRKAAAMFANSGMNIPLLGIVENMSYFTPLNHPNEKYLLFGKGGGAQLAKEMDVPLLVELPMVTDVCELADNGKTIFASTSGIMVEAFQLLALAVDERCRAVDSRQQINYSEFKPMMS